MAHKVKAEDAAPPAPPPGPAPPAPCWDEAKWKQKEEEDAIQQQQLVVAAGTSAPAAPLRWLYRQAPNNKTITSVIGGNPQLPAVNVSQKMLRERQSALVEAGELDRLEPFYVVVKNSFHGSAPGRLPGSTREGSGTLNMSLKYCLSDLGLPRNHDFPVFCGCTPENGSPHYWYVGNYRLWDPFMEDGSALILTQQDMVEEFGYSHQFTSLNRKGEAEVWVQALAEKECDWSSSLTTIQKSVENGLSASNFYFMDPERQGPLAKSVDIKRVEKEARAFLRNHGLLVPKSGKERCHDEDCLHCVDCTRCASSGKRDELKNSGVGLRGCSCREAAMRHFLQDEKNVYKGLAVIHYCWIHFVRFDDKLHHLLQERASGLLSTWKKKQASGKKQASHTDEASSSKRRRRNKQVVTADKKVRVEWTVMNDDSEREIVWFRGTLHLVEGGDDYVTFPEESGKQRKAVESEDASEQCWGHMKDELGGRIEVVTKAEWSKY
jgi:hypothetical protein